MSNITLTFGSVTVRGMLNDTKTAQAFAAKLPARIRVSGSGVDFCGPMPFDLPYENDQVHFGWHDGDINYNPGGGWFAVLHSGQQDSHGYGDQVVMGRIAEEDLDAVRSLSGSFDVIVKEEE